MSKFVKNPKADRVVEVNDEDLDYLVKKGFVEVDDDLTDDDKKYNELIVKLDDLKADEVKFVASHLQIEYTKIDETVKAIKEFLNIGGE